MYKVYVQTTNGIITTINSDAFLTDLWEYSKKPVYSIDENGNRTDYCSTSEAARVLNFKHLNKNFKRIVDNHHKACGCYWYYKEVS